jgi:hypothetical protein
MAARGKELVLRLSTARTHATLLCECQRARRKRSSDLFTNTLSNTNLNVQTIMAANRWRSGYMRQQNDTFTGHLTPIGSVQDVEVTFKLKAMQKIMEASEHLQVDAPNEYLIGALRDNDAGYKTADVIIYNKVVRLKLTEEDIKRSKTLSL